MNSFMQTTVINYYTLNINNKSNQEMSYICFLSYNLFCNIIFQNSTINRSMKLWNIFLKFI